MKNEKIYKKLFESRERLNDAITSQKNVEFIGFSIVSNSHMFFITSLIITSVIASVGGLGLSSACLMTGVLGKLLTGRNSVLKEQEIDKLTQEVAHIEKLINEGLSKSGELTLKRIFKIKDLKQELDVAEKCFKSSEIKSNIFAILSAVGIGLTATVNPLFVIATAIGFVLVGKYAKEAIDANAERQYINNRIDNLEFDVMFFKEMNESDKIDSKKVQTPLVKKALGNTNDKVIDPAVESAVDSYVESLANQAEELEKLKALKKVN